jgi:phospholipid/cholesterol/gamma-HCH transport system permease protein
MSEQTPGFRLLRDNDNNSEILLVLSGDWIQGRTHVDFSALRPQLTSGAPARVVADGAALGDWDSILMAFLLQCYNHCRGEGVELVTRNMPEGVDKLLRVATAVIPHQPPAEPAFTWLHAIDLLQLLRNLAGDLRDSLAFIGEVVLALARLVTGRANTRFRDFLKFCHQAGPDAFPIISLTSILVGMILAYLGAVQLRQFGAEIYVADLVVIGTLREMGVLMTAVVMAGRTGAAYAAQLGTMQANEEIDAITTMGISPVEFLVLPRLLALVAVMPLLTVYANLLGILGGGIVAGGMGITSLQYINASAGAVTLAHIGVGLAKSFVFAVLIAVAGCRSGISSGRDSAAVGEAATEAVVAAVVYLIIADAAFNIVLQQVGI